MKNYKAIYQAPFLKNLKKLIRKDFSLKKRIDGFFQKLLSTPFYPALKTHKVESRYGKVFSSRLSNDIRVLWKFSDKETILIFDIGSHDEIYS